MQETVPVMKPHLSDSPSLKVLGLMSGTSLDGLDLVAAEFRQVQGRYQFTILAAETLVYSKEWMHRLATSHELQAADLVELDRGYGHFLGKMATQFITSNQLVIDLIASHGHTVFHYPAKRFTLQIGHGAAVASETGLPVISDFRSTDVAMGGEGAPLVPAGDRLLFDTYPALLNLGGFANVSFTSEPEVRAGDICPVNIILNALSGQLGEAYDPNGAIGRSGKIVAELLEALNNHPFYLRSFPKSLGREWCDSEIFPLFNSYQSATADLLRTWYEHAAIQIAGAIGSVEKVLVTGGGTHNGFLIERIASHSKSELVIPSATIINFKEALIFAFLGYLRWYGRNNCLCSVTGARSDSSAGALYLP